MFLTRRCEVTQAAYGLDMLRDSMVRIYLLSICLPALVSIAYDVLLYSLWWDRYTMKEIRCICIYLKAYQFVCHAL